MTGIAKIGIRGSWNSWNPGIEGTTKIGIRGSAVSAVGRGSLESVAARHCLVFACLARKRGREEAGQGRGAGRVRSRQSQSADLLDIFESAGESCADRVEARGNVGSTHGSRSPCGT